MKFPNIAIFFSIFIFGLIIGSYHDYPWNPIIDTSYKKTKKVVNSVIFSPNERYVATTTNDHFAFIWDVNSGRSISRLTGHKSLVTSIDFSPDGQRIISGSNDETAKIWNVPDGKLLLNLTGHDGLVTHALFNKDGSKAATASNDGIIKIWDTKTGELLFSLLGHRYSVKHNTSKTRLQFSPDGKMLVSIFTEDQNAIVWDVPTGRILHFLKGNTSGILNAAFSKDGKRLLTATADHRVTVWDTQSGKPIKELPLVQVKLLNAIINEDGKLVVTLNEDNIIRCWDIQKGKIIFKIKGKKRRLDRVTYSPKDIYLTSQMQGKHILIYLGKSGKLVKRLKAHKGNLTTFSFNRDGKRLLTAADDGIASIWDTKNWKILTSMNHTKTKFK